MTKPPNQNDLLARLQDGLEEAPRNALDQLIDICRARDVDLYLVGGAVRDLILGRGSLDLDLAVETETAPIAEALAQATHARLVTHERFGTATIQTRDWTIDLARTRSETYSKPGALPDVSPAPLIDDLQRRDFSINATALRLSGGATQSPAGELIDPFGGATDLEARRLRVLHEKSFQDDATRLLRAMRYAARLNFKFEAETLEWLHRDRYYVESISAARLRRELMQIFEEPMAARACLLADEHGVLGAVHPALKMDDDLAVGWADALLGTHHSPLDELGFCLIATPETGVAVDSISARLHLAGRFENALRDFVRLRGQFDTLAALRRKPFEAVELLEGKSHAAIWALSIADTRSGGQTCAQYLNEWRKVRPRLNGDDLQRLGVQRGIEVGNLLRTLRRARLEGRAPTREDEIALVREETRR
jgi:tRNA nucleotidyltransferase (CCA-adding enzyme)